MLESLRTWLGRSLVRRVTLHVTLGLLLVIVTTATLSLMGTWFLTQERYAKELELKADFLSAHFEETLNGFSATLSGLANNRILANALLDSQGRERYLRPFMREFDFRIDEVLSLTLCDFLGRPMASSGVGEAQCHADSRWFREQLDSRQPVSFISVEKGRVLLVLMQPVIYPTTNTAEGALVGVLDLSTWMEGAHHIPVGYRAQLLTLGNDPKVLVGASESLFPPTAARAPRLATPFAHLQLNLQVGHATRLTWVDVISIFQGHGIAAIVLLVLGLLYARNSARRIVQPVVELAITAKGIANGHDAARAQVRQADEIGELASAFNQMVDRLEHANASLEAQVVERTEAARQSERREQEKARELSSVLDSMPAIVMVATASECRYLQINQALRDMLDHNQPEKSSALIELTQLASLDPRHYGQPLMVEDWPIVKAAREQVEIKDFACEITLPSGEIRHLLGSALPIIREGLPAGAIATYADVSSLRKAERQVSEQEERYRKLFDMLPEGVCVLDGERIRMTNAAMVYLAGYDNVDEIVGQHVLSFVHVDDRALFTGLLMKVAEQLPPFSFRLLQRDGRFIHAEAVIGIVRLGGERVIQMVFRDMTLRRMIEEQTRLAARAFEVIPEGIVISDTQGKIISANPAFTDRTGYTAPALLGADILGLSTGLHDESYFREVWHALATLSHWEGQMQCRHREGALIANWVSISAIRGADGELIQYIAIFSDPSERQKDSPEMAYLAQHDYLTGLPNRLLLRDRMDQAFGKARRNKSSVAVLFLDLDGFKQINDLYGHAVGDQLLKQVADRLGRQLRAMDSVCRLGGDEFVILLTEADTTEAVDKVAHKLCHAIANPYLIGTLRITEVSVSIGIAFYPEAGRTVEGVLEKADLAMYEAKRTGKNGFHFSSATEPTEQQTHINGGSNTLH